MSALHVQLGITAKKALTLKLHAQLMLTVLKAVHYLGIVLKTPIDLQLVVKAQLTAQRALNIIFVLEEQIHCNVLLEPTVFGQKRIQILDLWFVNQLIQVKSHRLQALPRVLALMEPIVLLMQQSAMIAQKVFIVPME